MFFLFYRPIRTQKKRFTFFSPTLAMFCHHGNIMISVAIFYVCLYLCRHNFFKSAGPIFSKFGAQVYEVPEKTP